MFYIHIVVLAFSKDKKKKEGINKSERAFDESTSRACFRHCGALGAAPFFERALDASGSK